MGVAYGSDAQHPESTIKAKAEVFDLRDKLVEKLSALKKIPSNYVRKEFFEKNIRNAKPFDLSIPIEYKW